MFLYLCCIFYFVVAGFAVNDTYIHFSDDETDQYFPSSSVNIDVKEEFEFPWTYESTGPQTGISTSYDPEPFSLKNIIELFVQQYGSGITNANTWHAVVYRPDAPEWNNLCDLTWHKKGEEAFKDIKCAAKEIKSNSLYWVYIGIPGMKLRTNLLKCTCPNKTRGKHYDLKINTDRYFFVARYTNENYFTLINVEDGALILYGYVMNIEYPFTKSCNVTRKYYYLQEATQFYWSQ